MPTAMTTTGDTASPSPASRGPLHEWFTNLRAHYEPLLTRQLHLNHTKNELARRLRLLWLEGQLEIVRQDAFAARENNTTSPDAVADVDDVLQVGVGDGAGGGRIGDGTVGVDLKVVREMVKETKEQMKMVRKEIAECKTEVRRWQEVARNGRVGEM